MRIVNTKGQKCPQPIIETKKAFRATNAGETFKVITDNQTSCNNITRFLKDNKIKFSLTEVNNVWSFRITKESGEATLTASEEYCGTESHVDSSGNYAVVISSEIMGQGDDDLGRQLMKSFFNTISCLDSLPSLMVFYNTGVKLAMKNSPLLGSLIEIEKKGVEILFCGTCVDYYKSRKKIGVGVISDMYTITTKLSKAGNIIKP
jgi:selenium metabolism protein YedF